MTHWVATSGAWEDGVHWWQAVTIVLAGLVAGVINTVVGSGTLLTFPLLLAVGYPPVTANVSNSLGLVPGALTGTIGYRAELTGQGARLGRLGPASGIGAIGGALLLLTLPAKVFSAIVPVLIGVGLALVIAQPFLAKKLADRPAKPHGHVGVALWLGTLLTGVYGGYFGAAQGVINLGLMGVLLREPLQRLNAIKIVLTGLANLTSGIVFVFLAHVAWLAVLLVATGSMVGGMLGARIGRRLSPVVLRGAIVVVGLVAIGRLVFG